MLLTKEAILAKSDRPTLRVAVPEWEGEVLICRMDGKQRAAFEDAGEGQYELFRATVVAMCVVDEAGAPLFTAADIAALNSKDAVAINRIFRACLAHNKLRRQDREDAEGNSDAANSAAFSSASPDTSAAPSPNS